MLYSGDLKVRYRVRPLIQLLDCAERTELLLNLHRFMHFPRLRPYEGCNTVVILFPGSHNY